MTIPEWAVVLLATALGVVIWWGVKRLVHSNDNTSEALREMSVQLGMINGRIGKLEVITQSHVDSDDKQFSLIHETHKELWYAINRTRPK